jgi:hypothetical protein
MDLVDPNNRYGQVTSGRLVMKGMVLHWHNEHNGVRVGDHDNGGDEMQRPQPKESLSRARMRRKYKALEAQWARRMLRVPEKHSTPSLRHPPVKDLAVSSLKPICIICIAVSRNSRLPSRIPRSFVNRL